MLTVLIANIHTFEESRSFGHMQRFLNSELPIDERVEDLISQLTLEEKISQMVHDALAVERIGLRNLLF